MNMIPFFRRADAASEITETLVADLDARLDAFAVPSDPTILDRSSSIVSAFLDEARGEKVRLETKIRDLQEQLRQTDLAIEAFEPTLIKLDDGYDPVEDGAKSYTVAIDAKKARKAKQLQAVG